MSFCWFCHTSAQMKTCGRSVFEPVHDKTNKMTLRSGKTQISLRIRPVWSVFAVHPVGSRVLLASSCAQQGLIRLGGCPGWSVLARITSFCWFCHAVAHFHCQKSLLYYSPFLGKTAFELCHAWSLFGIFVKFQLLNRVYTLSNNN